MVVTLALKGQSESDFCISGGKVFQSLTVRGKNDIFLLSANDLESVPGSSFRRCYNLLPFLMATSCLSTLYSIQRQASFLLFSRDRQFRPSSMSHRVTLDLLLCLLVTKHAARLCTISNFLMFFHGQYADPRLYLHIIPPRVLQG